MQSTYEKTLPKPHKLVNFLAFASDNFESKRPRHRVDDLEFHATIDSKKSYLLASMTP